MICWQVSKEDNIDIWKDPWIPSITNCKPPFGPKPQFCIINIVADLIDPDTRTWKVDIVNEYFPPWVVEQIILLPLSRIPGEDRLRWLGEKNGVFSVESAYNFLKKEDEKKKNQRPATEGPWKMLWKTNLAERAKLNMWKALKNGLPTKETLAKRGVPTDMLCVRCQADEETFTHALLSCPLLKDTWMQSDLRINTEDWKPGELFPNSLNPFPLLIEKMLHQDQDRQSKMKKLSYLAALTYAIWADRNNLKHNKKNPWVTRTLMEAEKLIIKTDNTLTKPCHVDWPQVPKNCIYVTIDAAWSSSLTNASIGFALWDFSGICLCAGYTTTRTADVEEAEARGVMRGLELGKELGIRDLKILSDCQNLISFLQNGSIALSWGANVVAHDILHLSSTFESNSFSFISRNSNYVSDILAGAGRNLVLIVCYDPTQVPSFFNYCKSCQS